MRTITVCVGSSCHMKGSHHVIDRLEELIEENNLQDSVELKASFCMDQCRGNIGTMVDGNPVYDLRKDNVDEVFAREFLSK